MNPTEILNAIGGCLHDINLSHGLILSLFLAGLVGGATHCVGMCGPFVMAQSSRVDKLRQAALLPYHLGRITTYVGMAVVLSSVVNLAFLFLPIRTFVVAPVLMLAGLIFLVSAFPALRSVFPWLTFSVHFLPQKWIEKPLGTLMDNPSIVKRYGMGVLLGFMPCGLIVSALMAAASAPSPIIAGVAMVAFGVGTIPALIAVAFGGQALKSKFPNAMLRVSQGFMTLSALWLFAMAGIILS